MANATIKNSPAARTKPKRRYWKIGVYPFEYGGEPDKHVIVLGKTPYDALNRVQRLFPRNGRLSIKETREAARYKAITNSSFLVEMA